MPAYYRATLPEFIEESLSSIIGKLALANERAVHPISPEQIHAWNFQGEPLRSSCAGILEHIADSEKWTVLIEYPIPRVGLRIDAVILAAEAIWVLEFKTGVGEKSGVSQVEDYALALANFHEPSHGKHIYPIAIQRETRGSRKAPAYPSPVEPARIVSFDSLSDELLSLAAIHRGKSVKGEEWDCGRFVPIPPIIEAAVALYSEKDIFEIEHACAAQESLAQTTKAIIDAVQKARATGQKLICFVTGVPGAGKTLVGLNAVHQPELRTTASFLSGNGPLVKVVQEALVRDRSARETITRREAALEVKTFIHNVHKFAEEFFDNANVPAQQVIVFDEAQRAWNAARNLDKFGRDVSEPHMLLEIMNRTKWSAIIALVGGGQEINKGEAGLSEWGVALRDFSHWRVWASPEALRGGDAVAGAALFEPDQRPAELVETSNLHLRVSVRSIRAQQLSDWVNLALAGKAVEARSVLRGAAWKPYVSRSLAETRNWLNETRIGFTRSGLICSATASRLRIDGLEPSFDFHKGFDWEHWFLDNPDSDTRSSSRLEVAATQFEIQGLELDWIGLCWGEDLIWNGREWQSWNSAFSKTKGGLAWAPNRSEEKHRFRINAYRVLLTRARQGLAIYVPKPDPSDWTRLAKGLDDTAEFLLECGAAALTGR
jgi:hypothetical protein